MAPTASLSLLALSLLCSLLFGAMPRDAHAADLLLHGPVGLSAAIDAGDPIAGGRACQKLRPSAAVCTTDDLLKATLIQGLPPGPWSAVVRSSVRGAAGAGEAIDATGMVSSDLRCVVADRSAGEAEITLSPSACSTMSALCCATFSDHLFQDGFESP